jgi:hypothetical protein
VDFTVLRFSKWCDHVWLLLSVPSFAPLLNCARWHPIAFLVAFKCLFTRSSADFQLVHLAPVENRDSQCADMCFPVCFPTRVRSTLH